MPAVEAPICIALISCLWLQSIYYDGNIHPFSVESFQADLVCAFCFLRLAVAASCS